MRKSTPVLTTLLTVIAFLPVSYNASWATETPAPAPSVSATASSQLEPTNGTYALGATGPGGGLIFLSVKKVSIVAQIFLRPAVPREDCVTTWK